MTSSARANKPPLQPADKGPMLCLYGRGVASGYAMGRAVIMGAAALEVAHYRIASDMLEAEKTRFSDALAVTCEELRTLAQSLPEDAPRELAALLNVHQLLLTDPLLADETLALIETRQYNAEWALTTQGQLLGEQFSAMEDEYLRERSADVRQVVERVLYTLAGTRTMAALDRVSDTDDPLIVVAHDISPADMIRLRGARFAGFVTDLGGPRRTPRSWLAAWPCQRWWHWGKFVCSHAMAIF